MESVRTCCYQRRSLGVVQLLQLSVVVVFGVGKVFQSSAVVFGVTEDVAVISGTAWRHPGLADISGSARGQ